jgi:hypothetical protein
MVLVRSLGLAVVIAALTVQASAKEAVRLRALDACPSGVDGCIEMLMHWDFARTDKPPVVGGVRDGVRVLTLRGRLKAGRVRSYRLAVSGAQSSRRSHLGEVAYLGRSKDGRPIIVTDQGPLAIETRGLNVGRGAAVVVIDTRRGAIVRALLGGLGGGAYVVGGAGRIGTLSKSGVCLSPPVSRPGALKPLSGCDDRRAPPAALAFSERIIGAIEPAPDADLALIRRLLPQTRDLDDAQLRAKIGRIDADHVVVTPWAE